MSIIVDSLVIKFDGDYAEGEEPFAILELDNTVKDDNNNVRATFPDDHGGIKLFFHGESNLGINKARVTSGSIVIHSGKKARSGKYENAFFHDLDQELDLSHIPSGGVSGSWYGNTASISTDGNRAKASAVPCIGDLSYSYYGQELTVYPPSLSLGEEGEYFIGVVLEVVEI